jgi:Polyketide cyclase / dehydrase and lipid transport
MIQFEYGNRLHAMTWSCRLLSCALMLSCCSAAAVEPDTKQFALPDEPGMARLRAGEWILDRDLEDASGAAVSIMLFFHAPAERIWGIIISCDYARSWVEGLEKCEVLEDRGDYAVTRQVVDKGWATPRIDYTFETFRIPFQSMRFRLTSGNLKTLQGSWEFTELPDGVVLRHTLTLQPNFPVPRWLVRRTLTRDMPDMMLCLRGLSEGSGSEQASAEERRICPGAVKEDHKQLNG